MSIIYALVARGTTILVENSISTGNFAQITTSILEKIPPSPSKLTYVYDKYLFHYIVSETSNLTFLCMADESFGRRIPFAFLVDLERDFNSTYTPAQVSGSLAYGLNEYKRTLVQKMEYFNSDPKSDAIRKVKEEIDQVKDVMVQNIEKVLERGERIDILVDKTDTLNQAAFQFKKRSTALKRQMWWKNTKLTVALVVICILVLYLIIGAGCGYPGWGKCFGR